jgi:hypothetical protein
MNFFSVALNMAHGSFAKQISNPIFQPLSSYIEKYWKKSISKLKISGFDLEECFTFMELQLREARETHDETNYQRLVDIEYLLKHLLFQVLSVAFYFSLTLKYIKTVSSQRPVYSFLVTIFQ